MSLGVTKRQVCNLKCFFLQLSYIQRLTAVYSRENKIVHRSYELRVHRQIFHYILLLRHPIHQAFVINEKFSYHFSVQVYKSKFIDVVKMLCYEKNEKNFNFNSTRPISSQLEQLSKDLYEHS